jgi:16S rRNA (guanine527-N7)-methyltransferase
LALAQVGALKVLFHVKHEAGDRKRVTEGATLLGIELSPRMLGLLMRYHEVVMARAVPMGLVASSDANRLVERHVVDSLRAAAVLGRERDAYDLGSGAGFPGVVVAIVRPDLWVGLVEAKAKRAAFLEYACEVLGLTNTAVVPRPARSIVELVDVCFARAFGSLRRSWVVARDLLRAGGRLVYFAGREPRPTELPEDAIVQRMVRSPVLESAGPLVIMARR